MKLNLHYITAFFLCLTIVGCTRKDEIQNTAKEVAIKVQLVGINNEIVDNFDKRSSVSTNSNSKQIAVHRTENGLDLVAELIPESTTNGNKFNKTKVAAIEPLGNNIRYKLVVYTAGGSYITDRDYIHTQEHLADQLWLEENTTYTFVAYSTNSTSSLPALTFQDGIQDLAHSQVLGINNSTEFLYFKIENKLISNSGGNNTVPITFRSTQAEVQIIIDAESEGTVQTALGNIGNLKHQTVNHPIHLATGKSDDTAPATASLTFTGLNTAIATSNILKVTPRDANSAITFTNLTVRSTVNPIERDITQTSYTPFTDLDIKPGHRYKLKITINPDWYFTSIAGIATERITTTNFRNYPAVRIKGRYWMLHNVGTDSYAVNPFTSPNEFSKRGLYFKWGVISGFSKANIPISPWSSEDDSPDRWNSGTEALPVKTSNDPCPSGWRVPTQREYIDLINATTYSNSTPWDATVSMDFTNTGAGKILTSKKTDVVKIIFPIAGYRMTPSGNLTNVGVHGFYWSSRRRQDVEPAEMQRSSNMRFSQFEIVTDGRSNLNNGFQLRCIADIRQNTDGSLVPFPF